MPEKKRKDRKVFVYTTPTCSQCRAVKEYLAEKKIAYVERNVGEDREAAREMLEKSGEMSVPVVIIYDKVVVGFNRTRLDRLLK
ncbi:MAG: glutaredoxin family protein [Chloroflexota bacterium]